MNRSILSLFVFLALAVPVTAQQPDKSTKVQLEAVRKKLADVVKQQQALDVKIFFGMHEYQLLRNQLRGKEAVLRSVLQQIEDAESYTNVQVRGRLEIVEGHGSINGMKLIQPADQQALNKWVKANDGKVVVIDGKLTFGPIPFLPPTGPWRAPEIESPKMSMMHTDPPFQPAPQRAIWITVRQLKTAAD